MSFFLIKKGLYSESVSYKGVFIYTKTILDTEKNVLVRAGSRQNCSKRENPEALLYIFPNLTLEPYSKNGTFEIGFKG